MAGAAQHASPSGRDEIERAIEEAYRTPPHVARRVAQAFGMDKEPSGAKKK